MRLLNLYAKRLLLAILQSCLDTLMLSDPRPSGWASFYLPLIHTQPWKEGRAKGSPASWKGPASQEAIGLLCGLGQLHLLLSPSESSPRNEAFGWDQQFPLLPVQLNHLGSFTKCRYPGLFQGLIFKRSGHPYLLNPHQVIIVGSRVDSHLTGWSQGPLTVTLTESPRKPVNPLEAPGLRKTKGREFLKMGPRPH